MDARNEFLLKVSKAFDPADAQKIMRMFDGVMANFDINPRCTAIVPYNFTEETEKIVNAYFAVKKVEGQSLDGINNYRYTLRKFFSFVNKPLKEINKGDCVLWLDSLDGTVSDRSRDKYRQYVNSFFAWCQNEQILQFNPMSTIKKIKYETPKRRPLTRMEMEKMIHNAETLREKAIVEFLYSTGCRVSEMTHVKRNDIDFVGKTAHVLGKNKKPRDCSLSPRTMLAIREYMNSREDNSPYLFVSQKNPHNALTPSSIERTMNKIADKAEITKSASPHVIRHTTATHMKQSGFTIEEVSNYLGHAQLSTTMIYVDLDDEDIRKKHERMFA